MLEDNLKRAAILLMGLLLAACGNSDTGSIEQAGLAMPNAPARIQDEAQLTRGKTLFRQHCARCHGDNAQGAPNWHKTDAEGFYPPPPLDGSGHAWHHSKALLAQVIENGSPPGKGKMPAWKGKLTDEEIAAVIAWFQSLWPQPVYDAWYEMQQRVN